MGRSTITRRRCSVCYPQLNAMQIAQHPVIAIRIEETTSWGNLSVTEVS
jgi:hypothetical protein